MKEKIMNILVNNNKVVFNKDDFPMLISGACKTGSSIFSVSLVTSLFEHDYKVMFLTAYPEAKVDFRRQLGKSINDKAIIIDSGDEEIFIEKLKNTNDLENTAVLLKNMENYSKDIFELLNKLNFVIFSGDLDNCEFANELIEKEFKTKIFFSYPSKFEISNKIELPKYHGLIQSNKYNGLISINLL